MRSYTIVGAGAVGLLYGTRLAAAGHPVRWVVRSGAEEIARDGIEVHTGGEVLRVTEPDVRVDPADAPASDVVIIALKTTANDHLDRLVAPAVEAGSTVAVFQNGLGVEQQAWAAVPQAGAVLGALCFVCVHRLGPGRADHLDYGAVTVGELGATQPSTEARDLVADLTAAGVEASSVDDLGRARWEKLVWNVPFNGLSVLLDASTDELLADRTTRVLVGDLMDEVITAARACGHGVERTFRDQMLEVTERMRPYAPSMKLDHDAGRALELDAIYDTPLELARQAAVDMGRTDMLARALHFLDRRRATGDGREASPDRGPASPYTRLS